MQGVGRVAKCMLMCMHGSLHYLLYARLVSCMCLPIYIVPYVYLVSSVPTYGTHQLQLKRDTRVPRMCRPRNPHALLLHACTFVCFYLLHHKHVRKHTSYVCMYTRFFTYTHVSHGVKWLYTRNAHSYIFIV